LAGSGIDTVTDGNAAAAGAAGKAGGDRGDAALLPEAASGVLLLIKISSDVKTRGGSDVIVVCHTRALRGHERALRVCALQSCGARARARLARMPKGSRPRLFHLSALRPVHVHMGSR